MSQINDSQPYDVFISYSSKDFDQANALYEALQMKGVRCWFAKYNIPWGENHGPAITRAIKGNPAMVMVLLFSSNADDSPHVATEMDRAMNYRNRIIPIWIEEVEPDDLEYIVAPRYRMEAFKGPFESHLSRIVDDLMSALKKEPHKTADSSAPNIVEAAIEEVEVPVEAESVVSKPAQDGRAPFEVVWQAFVEKVQKNRKWILPGLGASQFRISFTPKGNALGENVSGNAALPYSGPKRMVERVWNELQPGQKASNNALQAIIGKGAHFSLIGAIVEELRRIEDEFGSGAPTFKSDSATDDSGDKEPTPPVNHGPHDFESVWQSLVKKVENNPKWVLPGLGWSQYHVSITSQGNARGESTTSAGTFYVASKQKMEEVYSQMGQDAEVSSKAIETIIGKTPHTGFIGAILEELRRLSQEQTHSLNDDTNHDQSPLEAEFVARMSATLQAIYHELKRRTLDFGPDVSAEATKAYVKFEARKAFAFLAFTESEKALKINVRSDVFDISENATTIIHGVGVERRPDSHGPAKYFFKVDENTDLDSVEKLMRQSYETVATPTASNALLVAEDAPHEVYISHSSKDTAQANALCQALESRGIKCWIAPRDIAAGVDYGRSIIQAIKAAPAMVLIFSSHADSSAHVAHEVEMAMEAKASILPVRIENVQPDDLRYYLRRKQWVDASNGAFEKHVADVAHQVVQMLKPQPSGTTTITNPDPGGSDTFEAAWQKLVRRVENEPQRFLKGELSLQFRLSLSSRSNVLGVVATGSGKTEYTASEKSMRILWDKLKPGKPATATAVERILQHGEYPSIFMSAVFNEMRRL